MPELPEVEVVRAGVARHVTGAVLDRVEILGHRVARRHVAGPDDLVARLTGRRVVGVRRRGKYLWWELGPADGLPDDDAPPDEALVVHLGMSGQLLVTDAGAPRRPHQHATFDLGGRADAIGRQVRFVDQRTFGGLALVDLVPDPHASRLVPPPTAALVPASVAHIAPDPFEACFDVEAVVRAARRRDSAIKRVLLDQGLVSGIGNIYADEALWRARIHGERPARALSRAAGVALFGHVRDVMAQALAVGGTSFDALYVDVDGASGYFARSLDAYGREGLPCHRCGAPIRREEFMNRSSFSCPRCQRRPSAARPVR